MGRAGCKYGVPLLVGPRSVRVGRVLASPYVLDAGCRVACDVSTLGSPPKDSGEARLHIVPELATLVLGRLVADADNQRLVKPGEGSIGDRLQVVEHGLVVGLRAGGEVSECR